MKKIILILVMSMCFCDVWERINENLLESGIASMNNGVLCVDGKEYAAYLKGYADALLYCYENMPKIKEVGEDE